VRKTRESGIALVVPPSNDFGDAEDARRDSSIKGYPDMDPSEIVDPGAFWRGFFQSRPFKGPETSRNPSGRCLKALTRSALQWATRIRLVAQKGNNQPRPKETG
jgi:hypothetical protein